MRAIKGEANRPDGEGRKTSVAAAGREGGQTPYEGLREGRVVAAIQKKKTGGNSTKEKRSIHQGRKKTEKKKPEKNLQKKGGLN